MYMGMKIKLQLKMFCAKYWSFCSGFSVLMAGFNNHFQFGIIDHMNEPSQKFCKYPRAFWDLLNFQFHKALTNVWCEKK